MTCPLLVSPAPARFRRKQREQKQYSKQVQAERIKEKAQDKKRQIDSISKLRKTREKSVSEGGTWEKSAWEGGTWEKTVSINVGGAEGCNIN